MHSTSIQRASAMILVLLLGASAVLAQGQDLLVTNVQVEQRPHSTLVDVTSDLKTIDDMAVTVRLILSTDAGATYPFWCRAVSGDVGSGADEVLHPVTLTYRGSISRDSR